VTGKSAARYSRRDSFRGLHNVVNQASGRNLTHHKSFAAVDNPNPADTRVQIWYMHPIL
jgi:hypothetical protein